MYSQQLEQLIKSVIADGVITDKERAVLHKRAVAEGVDPDELDVYVDGLIPQRPSSDSATPEKVKEPKLDLKHLIKCSGEDWLCYQNKVRYKLMDLRKIKIDALYIDLIWLAKSSNEKVKCPVPIISVFGLVSSNHHISYNNPILELKTESQAFRMRSNYLYRDLHHDPNFSDNRPDPFEEAWGETDFWERFIADQEIIKALCDSEQIELNISGKLNIKCVKGYGDSWESRPDNIISINRDVSTWRNNLRVFYRSVYDNAAYPEAVAETGVNNGSTSEKATGGVGLTGIKMARLLGLSGKVMTPSVSPAPCYDQFVEPKSGVTVTHTKGSLKFTCRRKDEEPSSERNYKRNIQVYYHVLQEKNKRMHCLFEIGTTDIDEDSTDKNIPVDMRYCTILLESDTLSYRLDPICNDEKALKAVFNSGLMPKEKEHNYYLLPAAFVEHMMDSYEFELQIDDVDGEMLTAKPDRLSFRESESVAFPKKWKMTMNILNHPERREELIQEYEDSKVSAKVGKFIKGLFKK